MRPQRDAIFLWLLIAIGVALRLTDLLFPDFATDEAQAALGATAAWTPLGMQIMGLVQLLFGHEIIVARGVSVAFGIAFLPLLYALARHYRLREQEALLVTAIAAIFPSHILFSRLAYLSTQLLFGWTLTLFFFLKAREKQDTLSLVSLFLASVFVTLIKTQGLLLPLLLLLGTFVEQWRNWRKLKTKNYQLITLSFVLLLSLIPVTLYILTHPGIAATVLLYEGNLYGTAHLLTRVTDLLSTWWHMLSLFLLAMLFSLRMLPSFSWPLWITLAWVSVHGLLLGPGNPYYTTELVLFALPIALLLQRCTVTLRYATLSGLLILTLLLLGPRAFFQSPLTLGPYAHEGYWNTHAARINEVLKGEEAVTVLGYPGHHLRWYLEPHLLLGRNMTPPYPTKFLLVPESKEPLPEGRVVYRDETMVVLAQR